MFQLVFEELFDEPEDRRPHPRQDHLPDPVLGQAQGKQDLLRGLVLDTELLKKVWSDCIGPEPPTQFLTMEGTSSDFTLPRFRKIPYLPLLRRRSNSEFLAECNRSSAARSRCSSGSSDGTITNLPGPNSST